MRVLLSFLGRSFSFDWGRGALFFFWAEGPKAQEFAFDEEVARTTEPQSIVALDKAGSQFKREVAVDGVIKAHIEIAFFFEGGGLDGDFEIEVRRQVPTRFDFEIADICACFDVEDVHLDDARKRVFEFGSDGTSDHSDGLLGDVVLLASAEIFGGGACEDQRKDVDAIHRDLGFGVGVDDFKFDDRVLGRAEGFEQDFDALVALFARLVPLWTLTMYTAITLSLGSMYPSSSMPKD